MSVLSVFRRLKGSIRTSAFEQNMDAELHHHLELETDALISRGMTPEVARDQARRHFGSVAFVKDDCRESWGMHALDMLGQDVRFALRSLRKYPSYAAVVLLTLGLGIGANTAIFSVVHAVLLRPLPYANGDRLVEVRQQQPKVGIPNARLSVKEVRDYRAQTESLDAVVEYHQMTFNLLGRGDASLVQTGVVSANFFDVLGVTPLIGRTFREDDDSKNAPAVLILSQSIRSRSLAPPRLTAMLVTLFAAVALLITAAGIAGVVVFSVNQRTPEIGVRMALGAPRSSVVRMIVRQGLTPVTIGLAFGLAGALATTRIVAGLLFAVEPTDPITYAAVVGVLAMTAAIACLVPARRAAAIDPMRALRAD